MYRERFHRRFQPIVRRLADASNPVEFAVAYVAVMPSMLFITPLAVLAAVEATMSGIARIVNPSPTDSPYSGWFTSRHRVLGYWFGAGAIVSMWAEIAGVAVPWWFIAGCLAATLACLGPTLSPSTPADSDPDPDMPAELASIRRRYAEGELTDAEMEAELEGYWEGEILDKGADDDGDDAADEPAPMVQSGPVTGSASEILGDAGTTEAVVPLDNQRKSVTVRSTRRDLSGLTVLGDEIDFEGGRTARVRPKVAEILTSEFYGVHVVERGVQRDDRYPIGHDRVTADLGAFTDPDDPHDIAIVDEDMRLLREPDYDAAARVLDPADPTETAYREWEVQSVGPFNIVVDNEYLERGDIAQHLADYHGGLCPGCLNETPDGEPCADCVAMKESLNPYE